MHIRNDSSLTQHTDKVMHMLQRVQERSKSTETQGNPFSNMLMSGLNQVNNAQNTAESQMEQLITGGDVNQAEVFTSMQKADMSFRLLVQIRNKLMQAYEEINSIRV
jgi:flagellar hook-basal body complex protein FliE